MSSWSKDWVKYIDADDDFDIYPIQFANTERIEKNPAVYLFDETGCGKTISSALMTLHYLFNNREKDVLIISMPSVVSSGQLVNDYNKLPFSLLGFEKDDQWKVINNWYSNIEKQKKEWGLIIIDEAHLFLTAKRRKEALCNLRAEKVVFLTATPVKAGKQNLDEYTNIASQITRKELGKEWIQDLRTVFKDDNKKVSICSTFDPARPVTRYFKDIMAAIKVADNTSDFHFGDFSKKAVRNPPIIWKYENDKDRLKQLIKNIKEIKESDSENLVSRFVIFTRYIDLEQKVIEKAFNSDTDNSFVEFSTQRDKEKNNRISYAIINAETIKSGKYSLKQFCENTVGKNSNLPDVLIINYQIAEAGINLPGYNYVVNYHIPKYPAALEQRFGRIDRMGEKNGTKYDSINMAFLLRNDYMDIYTQNFYCAIYLFLDCLITNMPSKNTILTETMIDSLLNFEKHLEEIIRKREELMESIPDDDKEYDVENANREDRKLFDSYTFEGIIDDAATNHDFKEAIKVEIADFKSRRDDHKDFEYYKNFIRKVSDGIYCCMEGVNDPDFFIALDCSEAIYNSSEYNKYVESIREDVLKLLDYRRIRKICLPILEEYFEKLFVSKDRNSFTHIFAGKDKILNTAVFSLEDWGGLKGRFDIEQIREACSIEWIHEELPFFQMYRRFGEVVFNYCYSEKENYSQVGFKQRFDNDPFWVAYNTVDREFINNGNLILIKKDSYNDEFCIRRDEPTDLWCCSNWLKLALCSYLDHNSGRWIVLELIVFKLMLADITMDRNTLIQKANDIVEYTNRCGDLGKESFYYILHSEEKELDSIRYNEVYSNASLNLRKQFNNNKGQFIPTDGGKHFMIGSEYLKRCDFITYIYLRIISPLLYNYQENTCFGRNTYFASGEWIRAIIDDRLTDIEEADRKRLISDIFDE